MKTTLLLLLFFCTLRSDPVIWSEPTLLSSRGASVSDYQLKMDANGTAVAIWIEHGAVMFAQKMSGNDWSTPAQRIGGSRASQPQIGIDSKGEITALWLENGAVYTTSKINTESWNPIQQLSDCGADMLQLATGDDSVAIWSRQGFIETSTKHSEGPWGNVILLGPGNCPQVSIGPKGMAMAVWEENLGIFSSRKNIDDTWSRPELIGTGVYPCIGVDSDGNALAVWYNLNQKHPILQYASCSSNGHWCKPAILAGPNTGRPSHLKIGFNAQGDGVIAWNTCFKEDSYGFRAKVYRAGGTWEGATDLLTFNLHAHAMDLATTSNGETFVVYMSHDPSSNSILIQSTEAHIGGYDTTYWRVPTTLSKSRVNGYPKVAAALQDQTLHTAALWLEWNGSYSQLVGVTGRGTTILPPKNLTIIQNSHDHGLFSEYYNTLSWEPSPSPNIYGYVVLRNGEFFTRLGADVLQTTDRNVPPGTSVAYEILAIDEQEAQSTPAHIIYP